MSQTGHRTEDKPSGDRSCSATLRTKFTVYTPQRSRSNSEVCMKQFRISVTFIVFFFCKSFCTFYSVFSPALPCVFLGARSLFSCSFLLFIFTETNDVMEEKDKRTKINPDCGLTDEGNLNKNTIWPRNGKRQKNIRYLSSFYFLSYYCLSYFCLSYSFSVFSPFMCLQTNDSLTSSISSRPLSAASCSLLLLVSQLFSLPCCLQWNELSTVSVTMNTKRTRCPDCAPVCVVRFWLDLCKSTKCMHPHTHTVSPASACVCVCVWVGGRATTPICHPPPASPSLPLVASIWDNKNTSSKCLEWKIRSKQRERELFHFHYF